MTNSKERPILFSASMVRAILEDTAYLAIGYGNCSGVHGAPYKP